MFSKIIFGNRIQVFGLTFYLLVINTQNGHCFYGYDLPSFLTAYQKAKTDADAATQELLIRAILAEAYGYPLKEIDNRKPQMWREAIVRKRADKEVFKGMIIRDPRFNEPNLKTEKEDILAYVDKLGEIKNNRKGKTYFTKENIKTVMDRYKLEPNESGENQEVKNQIEKIAIYQKEYEDRINARLTNSSGTIANSSAAQSSQIPLTDKKRESSTEITELDPRPIQASRHSKPTSSAKNSQPIMSITSQIYPFKNTTQDGPKEQQKTEEEAKLENNAINGNFPIYMSSLYLSDPKKGRAYFAETIGSDSRTVEEQKLHDERNNEVLLRLLQQVATAIQKKDPAVFKNDLTAWTKNILQDSKFLNQMDPIERAPNGKQFAELLRKTKLGLMYSRNSSDPFAGLPLLKEGGLLDKMADKIKTDIMSIPRQDLIALPREKTEKKEKIRLENAKKTREKLENLFAQLPIPLTVLKDVVLTEEDGEAMYQWAQGEASYQVNYDVEWKRARDRASQNAKDARKMQSKCASGSNEHLEWTKKLDQYQAILDKMMPNAEFNNLTEEEKKRELIKFKTAPSSMETD